MDDGFRPGDHVHERPHPERLGRSELREYMLAVPYLISAKYVDHLNVRGAPAAEAFLAREHRLIEAYWNRYGNAGLVQQATRSLLDKVEKRLPPCQSMAALHVLEATALLAAAPSPRLVQRAQESAERALEVVGSLPSADHLELVNEALLVGAVARKALGYPDDCIAFLRTGILEWNLDSIGGVALERQEIMVTQDLRRHIYLLDGSTDYAGQRPREYYRTLKRVMEYLMNRGAHRQAEALAPEAGRAFMTSLPTLSFLARLSFIKNLGQFFLSTGQVDRGVKLLTLARRMATEAGFEGQTRQIHMLLMSIDVGDAPQLRTFRVVRT